MWEVTSAALFLMGCSSVTQGGLKLAVACMDCHYQRGRTGFAAPNYIPSRIFLVNPIADAYTPTHPAKWCFMKLSLISRTFQPAASAHPGSTPQPPNPFTTIASSSSIMNAAHLACKLCIRKLALHSSILGSDPIHAYSWNSKPYPGTCGVASPTHLPGGQRWQGDDQSSARLLYLPRPSPKRATSIFLTDTPIRLLPVTMMTAQ